MVRAAAIITLAWQVPNQRMKQLGIGRRLTFIRPKAHAAQEKFTIDRTTMLMCQIIDGSLTPVDWSTEEDREGKERDGISEEQG
jgi:hypothetical protein